MNQLRTGVLKPERGREKEHDIKNYNKQVWIIPRERSRSIGEIHEVKIKEVSIQRLIEIYRRRMEENLEEENLEKELTYI